MLFPVGVEDLCFTVTGLAMKNICCLAYAVHNLLDVLLKKFLVPFHESSYGACV